MYCKKTQSSKSLRFTATRASKGDHDVRRLYEDHIDLDFKPVVFRRKDHALDWGDVRVVSTSGDDNVVTFDRCRVGWVGNLCQPRESCRTTGTPYA